MRMLVEEVGDKRWRVLAWSGFIATVRGLMTRVWPARPRRAPGDDWSSPIYRWKLQRPMGLRRHESPGEAAGVGHGTRASGSQVFAPIYTTQALFTHA